MDEDFVLRAEELTARQVEVALAAARAREAAPPGFDGSCECGEDIPQARIGLGYHRCLLCQAALEKQKRLAR